jgi:hypothetical protein
MRAERQQRLARWALLVVLLAAFAVNRFAYALPVEFCDNAELEDDSDCFACAASLRTLESELFSGRVCYCPAAAMAGGGGCDAGTDEFGLVGWAADLVPGDGVFNYSLGWVDVSTVTFAGVPVAGGGGGPVPGFDVEEGARMWAAGFGLMFAFWSLGKVVGLVVDLFRK